VITLAALTLRGCRQVGGETPERVCALYSCTNEGGLVIPNSHFGRFTEGTRILHEDHGMGLSLGVAIHLL
jgi:hypothetical protein